MTRRRLRWGIILGAPALVAAVSFVPVGGGRVEATAATPEAPRMDLSTFPDTRPSRPLRLLFIHHSCGGQLLADPGSDDGEQCIYRTHPNGGGLRASLQAAGYEVHEASYGSRVGERTDLFDWKPKFETQMDEVLTVAHQDERLPDGRRNEIVVFKSCFPNSAFVGEGEAPGRADGPDLTVSNARATLRALLPSFARHPEVLFVYVTAPPLAPALPRQPAWKWLAKTLMGRAQTEESLRASGALARAFNDWVVDPGGWLHGYAPQNVVAFDYHRVLTGEGSTLLRWPTGDGSDSHPAAEGNRRAAAAFVPALNRAVRRAGLSE